MDKSLRNQSSTKLVIIAVVCCMGLITTAWVVDVFVHDLSFSKSDILGLYSENPIHYLLLSVLIVVPFLVFLYSREVNKDAKRLRKLLEQELVKGERVLGFIEDLRSGNVKSDIELVENDDISTSLFNLKENLVKNKQEEQQRRLEDGQRHWATEGLALFSEILRKHNDNMEEMSYGIISQLVKYLNVIQGGFYLLKDNGHDVKYFELIAHHAYDRKKFCDKRIEWGEGLIGVCALERNTIYIKEVTDSYINVTSGLGQANPTVILIVPLKTNDDVYGVVEFASFRKLESFEIEFVEKLAESIASTISSFKINDRTAKLLVASQDQAKKLSQQEELVRKNLDELKATQREAAKQAEQFVSFTNSVNHTLIRAEYSTGGILLYANTKFLQKLGYGSNSEVEGKHISIFINKKDREWFDQIWQKLAEGGPHFEGDMKHVTKQGKDLWTMATYVSIRDANRNPEKILFLGIDTTDQKKESLEYEGQIKALDRSTVKAIFSPEGYLNSYNNWFSELLKYESGELDTMSVFDFLHADDVSNFKNIWNNIKKEVPFDGQVRFCNKLNKEIWAYGTFSTVKDMYGDVFRIIFIGNDITTQKEIELKAKEQTLKLKEQEERLRMSKVELSKKLEETRKEMRMQFKETETVKMLNEKTLEGMLDAIVTINKNNEVSFFNKAAEVLWGHDRNTVLGKDVCLLLPSNYINDSDGEYLGKYFKYGEKAMVGVRTEVFIVNSTGEQIAVLVTLSEAMVEGEYTLTAFVQNIEVELF